MLLALNRTNDVVLFYVRNEWIELILWATKPLNPFIFLYLAAAKDDFPVQYVTFSILVMALACAGYHWLYEQLEEKYFMLG
jgi:hypothetical protein